MEEAKDLKDVYETMMIVVIFIVAFIVMIPILKRRGKKKRK
ncbi:hypothetical protein [Paenibacillus swuensis]|nr:hypothetical protein [Paenibacillus swuensis]